MSPSAKPHSGVVLLRLGMVQDACCPGIHMLLVIALSFFIRMNRTAGCTTVWLNSPPLLFVTFFFNYLVGSWMLFQQPMGWHEFLRNFVSAWHTATGSEPWYQSWWAGSVILGKMALEIAGPLWLGSIVVGFAAAVPTYFFVRWLVTRHHKARHAAHLARAAQALPIQGQTPSAPAGDRTDGKTS